MASVWLVTKPINTELAREFGPQLAAVAKLYGSEVQPVLSVVEVFWNDLGVGPEPGAIGHLGFPSVGDARKWAKRDTRDESANESASESDRAREI
eukprot:1468395-Rhodomonas_salina.2